VIQFIEKRRVPDDECRFSAQSALGRVLSMVCLSKNTAYRDLPAAQSRVTKRKSTSALALPVHAITSFESEP
jgi:hypothetical protein